MSEILEIVRIKRPEVPGGFCEINKTDLKKGDVLYKGSIGDTTPPTPKPKKAPHDEDRPVRRRKTQNTSTDTSDTRKGP